MSPSRNPILLALNRRLRAVRDERGFMILQVLVIIWLISAITLSAATLIVMEQSSYMHARDKENQLDKSDAALGWLAANVEPAQLPLKATSSDSLTWVYNGNCIKVYVDTTAKKLLEKQKSYSGTGDCSTELSDPSIVPTTLATNVDETVLPAAHPSVFAFYTGVDNTSAPLPANAATTAKSFDITLPLDGVMDPAASYAPTYHVIFGGVVASSKIADNAVTNQKLAAGAVTGSKLAANGVPPAAFDANALSTRDFIPLVAGDSQNYAPQGSTGTNTWRANTTSATGAGLAAANSAYTLVQVNYADRCVPGKQLWARGVYTIYNPPTPNNTINVGVRMREYDGPNPPSNLSSVTGASVYQVAPSSVPDSAGGFYAERASAWRMIDGGACSPNNELVNTSLNPRFYQLETNSSSTDPFAVVNAGIELRYTPAASALSAQPPYVPEHVAPADGSFVLTATPTLKARFSDPNQADTGQLNFQVCSDPACGTVITSGSSANGIANGSSGTWTVPNGSLLDGGTYYWRVQGQDNTGLTSSFAGDAPTQFKVSTTPPTLSLALVVGTNPQYQSITGTTVYFNSNQSGSFTVKATAVDSKWPLDTLTFPALGTNWAGGGTANSPPNSPPTTDQTYSWSSGAGTKSPATVTASSTSSRTATANFDAVADGAGPTGGAISYVNGTISSGPVALSGTFAADSASGMSTGIVERRSDTASSCGTSWSAWATVATIGVGTGPWSTNDNGVSPGNCYQYRYTAGDKVSNTTSFTTTATVQIGSPPLNTVAPQITDVNGAPLVDGDQVTTDNGTWNPSPSSYSYAWDVCGYKGVVQQDSPAGYWRLGEPSGWAVAVDESGNGNGGWYTGTPTLGATGALAGDPNTAATFSAGNYLTIPSAPALNVGDSFTLEAWVKRSATGATQRVFDDGTNGFELEINSNNKIDLGKTGAGVIAWSTTTITDTNWHYIAATKNGVTVHLYIDGTDVTGSVTNYTVQNTTTPLWIGHDAANEDMTGSMDDVAVYPTALSAARISAHYQAGNAGTGLCSAISGKTASSLTVGSAQVGSKIRSEVTATNNVGSSTAPSAQSSVVQAVAPTNTSVPTIADVQGNVPPVVGDTLNASTGVWTGSSPSYSYQWQRCDASGSAVMADTPSGFWRLNEPNSSFPYASDSSGNARAGAYIGTPTYGATGPVTGSPNTSVSFDGSTQAVSLPAIPLSGAFSLEAWVNLAGDSQTGQTGYGTIMGSDSSGLTYHRLLVSTSGQLLAQVDGSGNFFSTSNISLNTWHLVDFVYTGSNAYWYIDGASAGSEAASGLTWNQPFKIGAYDMNDYMFNGKIADVAVYSSALSAARVGAHFASASAYCSPIAGAIGSSYTVQAADAGAKISVQVVGANPAGKGTVTSTATGRVSSAAPVVDTPPAVSGTLQVGQSLTSSAGTFGGTTPLTKSYAWQRCGYGAAVLGDSPASWWRLGETSGTGAADQTGFASGSYSGGPALGRGGALALDGDSAVSFNGTNQSVSIASPPQLDSGNWTIEGWFQTQSSAVQQIYISGYSGGNASAQLLLNPNGQPYLYARDASGTVASVQPSMNLADSQWHYIAGTRNGNTFTLYVDGAQVGTATGSLGDVDDPAAPAAIGNGTFTVNNRWFNGKLDEVAVYKSALPLASIQAHYNMGRLGCATISGQTTSSYTPTAADWDARIRSVVTASNSSGSASSGSQPSAQIQPAPSNITPPTTSGVLRDGQLVQKTSDGVWTGAPSINYRWQHCQDYQTTVMSDHPAGYWRLNETSGTSAADTAGGAYGTYTGATVGAVGALSPCAASNAAASFNGSSSYISIPNSSSLTPSGPSLTLEAWVKVAALNTGNTPIFWKGDSAGSWHSFPYYLSISPAGKVLFGISNGTAEDDLTSAATLTTGTWYHIAATASGSTLRVYINGVQDANTTSQTVSALFANSQPLILGSIGAGGGAANVFNGSIDEAAVYPTALSGSQISSHYAAGTGTWTTVGSGSNNYTLQSSDINYRLRLAVDATTTGGTTTAYSTVFNGETYQAAVMDDEPTRYWRLGETSGTSAADTTGNENLTYANSPTLGQPSGLVGSTDTAVTFNGSNQDAGAASAASRSYATTLEGWVKMAAAPGSANANIVGSLGSPNGTIQLGIHQTDGLPFFVLGDGATFYSTYGPRAITDNQWHYLVGTWDGTTANLYVDGALVTTQNLAGVAVGALTCPWQIGGVNCATTGYSGQYLNGAIDDVAVYDHALTSSDVLTHWNAARGGIVLADIPTAASTPAISGKPQVSQTLTSTGTSFSGSPTVSTSYQWQHCGYKAAISADNPVEYLRLGEPAPQSARDETIYNATGTYINFTNAQLGQTGALAGDPNTAASFTGSNYITASPNVPTGAGNPATVEFWMNWDGTSGSMPVAWGSGYDLYIGGGYIGFNSTNGDIWGVSSSGLANGWHLVDAVFPNGPAASAQLYIDGVQQSLAQDTGTTTTIGTGNGAETIGAQAGGGGYGFHGRLDEFAVYQGSLSARAIARHHTAGIVSGGVCSNIAGETAAATTVNYSPGTLTADNGDTLRIRAFGTNAGGQTVRTSPQTAFLQNLDYREVSALNPVGFWRLDEASGTTAADLSGRGNTGTYSGGFTLNQPGAFTSIGDNDASASFDGTSGTVTASVPQVNTTAGGYNTVVLWMYSNGNSLCGMPFGFATYDLYLGCGTGAIGFNTANSDFYGTRSFGTLSDGWHQVVGEFYNGVPTGNSKLWVDGVQRTLAQEGSPVSGTATTGVHISGWGNGSADYFAGKLDDVALYNYALTNAQVQQLYNAGVVGPPANTVPPSLTGTAQEAQTLTATPGTWTGLLPLTTSFQWRRCDTSGANCSNIAGATGSTYTLTAPDVGSTIRVQVTGSNTAGTSAASSAQTATITALPPANTALPVISDLQGDNPPTTSDTLSTTNGTWTSSASVSYAYQWQRGPSYSATVQADSPLTYWHLDESQGATTAVNVGSDGAAKNGTYSGATLGQAGALPAEGGTSLGGGAVSTSLYGTNSNFTLEGWVDLTSQPGGYTQMLSNGDGSGSTGGYGFYAYGSSSNPCTSSCADGHAPCPTPTASQYTAALFVSGDDLCVLAMNVPLNSWHLLAVSHSGTGASGTWSIYLDGVLQSTVTSSSGIQSTGSMNHAPSSGSLQAQVPSTGFIDEPAFYGTTLPQTRLQAHYTTGATPSFSDIPGATSSTYALTGSDLGSALRAKVTATNSGGSNTAIAKATGAAATPAAPTNTVAPNVTGTTNPGSTLTATSGTWTGTTPMTYSYQWQESTNGGGTYSNISGATGSTYTLVNNDSGYLVRVQVTAQNSVGMVSANSTASSIGGRVVSINGSLYNLDAAPVILSYTGSTLTLVPRRSFSVTAKLWAGGGAGGSNGSMTDWGGGGGAATATVNLTAGQSYSLLVGGGGTIGGGRTFGGGGSAAVGDGGSGGGYSGIFNTGTVSQGNALLMAGGGGGGADDPETGGAGGGTGGYQGNGGCGCNGNNGRAGGGGDQGGPGVGGNSGSANPGHDGSALQGGDGSGAGHDAGGGGGYYGGGGGGSGNGGSGGGGSGYCSAAVSGCSLYQGSGQSAGNSGDSDRSSAGTGGSPGNNAANGIIVLR